jgi:outer membrane protein assembly factor BamB
MQGIYLFESSADIFATGIRTEAQSGTDLFQTFVVCIDEFGEIRWRGRTIHEMQLLRVKEGRLAGYMNNGRLKSPLMLTLDAQSGKLLGRAALPDSYTPLTFCTSAGGEEHIVCDTTNKLVSFSLKGEKRWEMPLAAHIDLQALTGDIFSFATYDGGLYGVDAATGQVVWANKLDEPMTDSASGETKMYFKTGGKLIQVDRATGRVDWREQAQDADYLENDGGFLFEHGSSFLRPLKEAK